MEEDDKVARASPAQGDSDEEEDMPDYRVLSALSSKHLTTAGMSTDASAPSIPKRGEKDFEPTGFGGQIKVLEQSRHALFTTISLPRAHSSKTLCTATWDPHFQRAFVHAQRGQSCTHMGVSQRRRLESGQNQTCLELFPEETIYLIERGALDCRWTQTPGAVPSADAFLSCIPISASQAFSHLMGQDGCTMARYQIYAYLKRLGYIVQRASLVDQLRATASQRGLLGISATDSFDTVFDTLRIVATDEPESPTKPVRDESLQPFFYAWRPASHFKRSHPPPPEFRICVLEADQHPMLNGHDFDTLFSHIPIPSSTGSQGDDKELAEVRAQNRRAYGKQRTARVPPATTRNPSRLRSLISRLTWILHILQTFISKWGISCVKVKQTLQ
ncbi:tRNA-splicing endonuclease subunit sen54 [Malassezia arunalokei]|uniref:tRNA-splicing endonuclease subunit sen54 n=1 Tax=Malassezia arunalokei TaxID=1514897 RepID=A0AAJ5Z5I9_9BASI|nr:tRNA-splicing endonuclease subunit sen54 [Malassezia arunalokei]